MSRSTTKPTKWPVPPAKTQISLGIRPISLVSSLCTLWVVTDCNILQADNKSLIRLGRVFLLGSRHFVYFVMFQLNFLSYSHVCQEIWATHLYRNIPNNSPLPPNYALFLSMFDLRAASWQNQQKGMCAQRTLRSAWESALSSLCAQWVAKEPIFLHADCEDADKTGQMSLHQVHRSFCWFCHAVAVIANSTFWSSWQCSPSWTINLSKNGVSCLSPQSTY